ncbi:hypothetical protein A3A39_02400 [Candidatus Kaiserbacteria bacterium RIFCSPLOWO2_01_FULL_54_13]|uniref:MaoC-like domain-containing protein n=1 Tax=Candidatus Kaiserbacteria bacterium RIFCSPLOWO2_01_FULL_54_13 TaxID=1798512 RepID=A0A1F6F152_9BACT|nr:MAG: hypothetical protein A3A39_02400 [Candidatus Kaiserbacteria bacterium RIFCSPLOWO2_01_FULL_54_13]
MKKGKTFDEIQVGDTASFTIEITEKMHREFENLSEDESPVHTDDVFAKKSGFDKKIGYAFLLTSFLSRLYGMYLPGGTSVCLKQETSFPNPYYVGDTISVEAEVIRKIASTRIAEIRTRMKRQNGKLVLSGLGAIKLLS